MLVTVLWYATPENVGVSDILILKNLVLFISWILYAISGDNGILSNRFMKYFSTISLEIYLVHMFIYRIMEKINLIHFLKRDCMNYIFVWVSVVMGSVFFVEIYRYALKKLTKYLNRSRGKNDTK